MCPETTSTKKQSHNSILNTGSKSSTEDICTLLSRCNFNCWYKDNSPVFQLGEYQIQNNFWVIDRSYIGKRENEIQHNFDILARSRYYKDIVSSLNAYKVHRTYSNYPFLEFEYFYWKEGYFYSKSIDIQSILKEVKHGPVYCYYCRNNVTKYNYFERYCQICEISFPLISIPEYKSLEYNKKITQKEKEKENNKEYTKTKPQKKTRTTSKKKRIHIIKKHSYNANICHCFSSENKQKEDALQCSNEIVRTITALETMHYINYGEDYCHFLRLYDDNDNENVYKINTYREEDDDYNPFKHMLNIVSSVGNVVKERVLSFKNSKKCLKNKEKD